MSRTLAFALGVALDAGLGDPPTRFHPVGLVGAAAHLLRTRAPSDAQSRERYGLVVAAGLPLAGALLSYGLRRAVGRGEVGRALIDGLVLDACSSLRTLSLRASEVEAALAAGDLPRARMLCATHLVSRDTSTLSASEVAGATIESVAENLSDAVVAPWLAFAVGGAPAAAYRVANTMDALWGYRTEQFHALGHASARLDDVLNVLPARLTALAIVLAAGVHTNGSAPSARSALATWWADARRTESPNAGHPMAAMAGAIEVVLAKRGAYTLGAAFRKPAAADIGRAIRISRRAALLIAVAVFGTVVVTGAR